MANEASGSYRTSRTVAITCAVPAAQINGTVTATVFGGVNVNVGVGSVLNVASLLLAADASVAGLSLDRASTAATGLATATVHRNGAPVPGASLTVNGASMFLAAPFARDLYPLARGDLIQMGFTSSNWSQAVGGLLNATLFLWL